MIRTRYTLEENLNQSISELESKGYEIVDTIPSPPVVQIKYRISEVANSIFEESLKQLKNGNISDGE